MRKAIHCNCLEQERLLLPKRHVKLRIRFNPEKYLDYLADYHSMSRKQWKALDRVEFHRLGASEVENSKNNCTNISSMQEATIIGSTTHKYFNFWYVLYAARHLQPRLGIISVEKKTLIHVLSCL